MIQDKDVKLEGSGVMDKLGAFVDEVAADDGRGCRPSRPDSAFPSVFLQPLHHPSP